MRARDGKRSRRGLGRAFAVFALLCSLLAFLPAPVRAATLHHAGVIVRHGNGGLTFAVVSFPEDELNAVELLNRANLGAVTVEFGGLGSAVCMIEREGCPPSVCQKKVCQEGAADSPFWHFYEMSSTGEWQFAALGASSVHVKDGEVTGWSWTGDAPKLPATSFSQLQSAAAQAGSPHGSSNEMIWRSGPLPATADSSRQSWLVYAGAGAAFLGVLGVLAFVLMCRRRPPGASFDDGG